MMQKETAEKQSDTLNRSQIAAKEKYWATHQIEDLRNVP